MKSRNNLILPVEGLRGVAVSIVLLYHLEIQWFSGGFIGVDIFFVISGFLIAKLLRGEYDSTGSISLRHFYARRARRILPAATAVLLGTVIGARFFLEPLRLNSLTWDAIASASFWVNILFERRSIDYLLSSLPPSPLQHYWSLSVEEQFYFIFPALLLTTFRISRSKKQTAVIILATVGLLSFAFCVSITGSFRSLAFFYLPSRAWQFIGGALIPFVPMQLLPVRSQLFKLLPFGGLLLLGYSVTRFDESTSYPGAIAIIPTVAAFILIVLSTSDNLPNRWLSNPVLLAIGQRSFALYLWHWPIIIAVKGEDQTALSSVDAALAILITFVLTEITHRFIENPIRYSKLFSVRVRRSLVLAIVLVTCGVLAGILNDTLRPPINGVTNALDTNIDSWPDLLREAPQTVLLPQNLSPRLEIVFEDEPRIYQLGCHDYDSDEPRVCEFGNPSSETRLAIFGDSHAAQWFEPLKRIIEQKDWYLLSITRSGCSPLPGLMQIKCQPWYSNAIQVIHNRRIQTVLVSSLINATELSPNDLRTSLMQLRENLAEQGATSVFVQDTPRPLFNIPICLSEHADNIQVCNLRKVESVSTILNDVISDVFDDDFSSFLQVEDWFCVEEICPSVIGNTVVYRDDSHISTRYAEVLIAQIQQSLIALVAKR